MAEDRPSKRIKIDSGETTVRASPHRSTTTAAHNPNNNDTRAAGKLQQEVSNASKTSSKAKSNVRKPQKSSEHKDGRPTIRTFSQPSVLCVGDKGVLVTSDKGCEKKALLEFHDMLQDYFESQGTSASGVSTLSETSNLQSSNNKISGAELDTLAGIEADIASELAGLKQAGQPEHDKSKDQSSRPMQLITLDIPCVSFVRLPPRSTVDPVEVVHRLCSEASNPKTPQRSRFVKRLTPISSLAKTLSQGLETVSEKVLPGTFGPGEDGKIKSVKFAIRPTIRENEQLDRDLIIKPVAERIQELGEAAHKVDLKLYEKGVIVEVYRGWIGMCVVDNIDPLGERPGYEQLRRFNLSEVYAKR